MKPLCREPWENFYILRRGIAPCCYGNPILAPMSDWAETWNSPPLQEIREYLSRGELSPYCLKSPSCPIVRRHQGERRRGFSGIRRLSRFTRSMKKLSLKLWGGLRRFFV